MSPALARRAPVIVTGAVVVLAVAFLIIAARTVDSVDDVVRGYALQGLVLSLGFGLTGALVLRDSPGNALGPMLSAMGVWMGLGNVGGAAATQLAAGSTAQGIAALVNGLWMPVVCGFLAVPLLYPDGRAFSPRWRWAVPASVACTAMSAVATVLSPEAVSQREDPGVVNPFGIAALTDALGLLILVSLALALAIGLAALVGQVLRVRRLSGDERARILYLAAATILLVSALMVPWKWVNLVLQTAAFAALAVGVLRHHLFDIQRVLSRSVVYVLLVGAGVLAAVVTAVAVGSLAQAGAAPAVAAAVTAVALASGYGRILRAVERVLFGPAHDPAEALRALGAELEAAADPEEVLPRLVAAAREALRLPYAAITLSDELEPAAQSGIRPHAVVEQPLTYGRQVVGSLTLGMRQGESELTARDARLVSTLGSQAGAVAHSAQAIRELRRSRERIVTAREEERRDLRRDLHDGLGPTLAGMSLGLESLGRASNDEDRDRLIADLLAQSREGLEEVRRIARALRPAALDELGLVSALELHAASVQRMSGGRLEVSVEVAGAVDGLPAAVEVAAYRIAHEALSNVTRHAGASRCAIALAADESLQLTVTDDGSGVAPEFGGTGLRSMRDRAEELGGWCTVEFTPGTGAVVRASLPLGVATASGTSAEPTAEPTAELVP